MKPPIKAAIFLSIFLLFSPSFTKAQSQPIEVLREAIEECHEFKVEQLLSILGNSLPQEDTSYASFLGLKAKYYFNCQRNILKAIQINDSAIAI